MITVQFRYLTGIPEPLFTNARLTGSFNDWVELPMQPLVADDGCPGFGADVQFEDARAGEQVRWVCDWTGRAGRTPGGSVPRCPGRPPWTGSGSSPCRAPVAGTRSGTT